MKYLRTNLLTKTAYQSSGAKYVLGQISGPAGFTQLESVGLMTKAVRYLGLEVHEALKWQSRRRSESPRTGR